MLNARRVTAWLTSAVLVTLTACGGGGGATSSTTTPTTTYTIAATVVGLQAGQSVKILDNGGDGAVATASGAYTFTTPLPTGTSYSVTVGTQPAAQICSVVNGAGTVGSADVANVQVNCAAAYANAYAYVANASGNSISAYTVDTTTGALIPMVGSPFGAAGNLPVSITVNSVGTVAYAANFTDHTVSAYPIDPNTGALLPGTPYLTGGKSLFHDD